MFLLKMELPIIDLEKISLGKTKKNNEFNFKTTPIFYDGYPFEMVVYGYAKFFSFNKNHLSIGLEIDEKNRDFFEKIEKSISDLHGKKLHLIKKKRVYAKLFVKNGKVQTPVGIFFDDTKIIENPFDYMNIPYYARIVLRISRIYDGKCLSIICEANEVVVQ